MPPKKKASKKQTKPQPEPPKLSETTHTMTEETPTASSNKIPKGLLLTKVALDDINKAFHIRVKNLKLTTLNINNYLLLISAQRAIADKKLPQFETANSLFNHAIRSVHPNNKYLRNTDLAINNFTLNNRLEKLYVQKLKCEFPISHNYIFRMLRRDGSIEFVRKSLHLKHFIKKNGYFSNLSLAGDLPRAYFSLSDQPQDNSEDNNRTVMRLSSNLFGLSLKQANVALEGVHRLAKLKKFVIEDFNRTQLRKIERIFNIPTLETAKLKTEYRREGTKVVDLLVNSPQLKHLCIQGQDFSLVSVAKMQGLRTLSLINFFSDENLVEMFTGLQKYNTLESLKLHYIGRQTYKELAQSISGIKSLKELDFSISSYGISRENFSEFTKNFTLPLESLRLILDASTKEDTPQITAFGEFLARQTELKKLVALIRATKTETNSALKKALAKMSKLEHLTLTMHYYGGLPKVNAVSVSEAFSSLNNLKTLYFAFTGRSFEGEELKKLLRVLKKFETFDKLTLNSSFSKISAADFEHVINFVKTRDRRKFKEIYIKAEYYHRNNMEDLQKELKKFQALYDIQDKTLR